MAESALENVKWTVERRNQNIKKGKTTEGARGYQFSTYSALDEMKELAKIKNVDNNASTRIMNSGNVNIRCAGSNIGDEYQRKTVAEELKFNSSTNKIVHTLVEEDRDINDVVGSLSQKKKVKKTSRYFVIASSNINIRKNASASSKLVGKFEPGKRIDVVLDEKTLKLVTKVDKDGRKWVQVVYDDDEIGWVVEEFVYRDGPIVTTVPNKVVGKVNNKKKTLYPVEKWGITNKTGYDKGVQKEGDRYKVAVGPKILNPRYPDDGAIQKEDFIAFNKNIEVILCEKNNKNAIKTIPCVVTDYKAHSYNKYPDGHGYISGDTASFNVENGILQTGIAYPKSWNGNQNKSCAKENMDSSVIEFCGTEVDFKIKNYELVKVISNN
jgi:hypothetical protein